MIAELTWQVATDAGMVLPVIDEPDPAGDKLTTAISFQLEHSGSQNMADKTSRDELIELNYRITKKRQDLEIQREQFEVLRSELAALRTERDKLKAKLGAETSEAAG
ncbi:MAG: hypothetical protein GY788_30615 [bacterium]|nr:hypothetical protein [bacterium]